MDFACVTNPVSGKGKARVIASALSARLEAAGHRVLHFESHGDSNVLRQRLAPIKAHHRMIVIGGDGTLNQVVNCAPHRDGIAFYGMGTANVMRLEFKLPKPLDAFAAMLEADQRREVYLGQTAEGRLFFMMAGFGLDSFILKRVSQSLKNRIGQLAFLPAGLAALWQYAPPRVRFRLDEGQMLKAYFAVFSKIKRYAGPFLLAPQIEPTEPAFEITAILSPHKAKVLQFYWNLFWSRPQRGKGFVTIKTTKIHDIVCEQGQADWQLDGDVFAGTRAIEISTHTASLIVQEKEDQTIRGKNSLFSSKITAP